MAQLIDNLIKLNCSTEIDGKWVIARPEKGYGLYFLIERIKDTWGVLIGKFDAISFYKQ
jgi:hypothetical protein